MSVVITEHVTVAEIDEAMQHVQALLRNKELKPTRRNALLETLDDLLDERLKLTQGK